jgi:hypothetical protein
MLLNLPFLIWRTSYKILFRASGKTLSACLPGKSAPQKRRARLTPQKRAIGLIAFAGGQTEMGDKKEPEGIVSSLTERFQRTA